MIFGSIENLLLGTIVLVIIIALKHGTKGITSASSVLIGIIAGYIYRRNHGCCTSYNCCQCRWCRVYKKHGVLKLGIKVAQAGWFAIPKILCL